MDIQALAISTNYANKGFTNLQTYADDKFDDIYHQLDLIKLASDVSDVVGSYNALMQYNKNSLTANDIVKVLNDESQANTTGYYRLIVDGNNRYWSYIGSEGAFYTQSEVDVLLNQKYVKPVNGIPKTDLEAAVQTSLNKADTALQEHQSLNDYYTQAQVNNLVNSKHPRTLYTPPAPAQGEDYAIVDFRTLSHDDMIIYEATENFALANGTNNYGNQILAIPTGSIFSVQNYNPTDGYGMISILNADGAYYFASNIDDWRTGQCINYADFVTNTPVKYLPLNSTSIIDNIPYGYCDISTLPDGVYIAKISTYLTGWQDHPASDNTFSYSVAPGAYIVCTLGGTILRIDNNYYVNGVHDTGAHLYATPFDLPTIVQQTGNSLTSIMSQDATTTAINNAVAEKQNVLNAGTHITINNDTISATNIVAVNITDDPDNINDLVSNLSYNEIKTAILANKYVYATYISRNNILRYYTVTETCWESIPENDVEACITFSSYMESDTISIIIIYEDNTIIEDSIPVATYRPDEKTKLNGIAAGAEVNVQANWEETDSSSDAYILNKPQVLDGRSAYQVAVANGYSGTEQQWLASLVGAQGETGANIYVGNANPVETPDEEGYPNTAYYFVEAPASGIRVGDSVLCPNSYVYTIIEITSNGYGCAANPINIQGAQGIQGIQGPKGDTGDAFAVYSVYATTALMEADAANVPVGKFVLISSDTESVDNAKLYVRDANGFNFLTDLSGAQGIRGPLGGHFKPSVNAAGDLSWTYMTTEDNGSTTPPETINIKGPKGDNSLANIEVGTTYNTTAQDNEWNIVRQTKHVPITVTNKNGVSTTTTISVPAGPIYLPQMANDGTLSWTNDAGFINPTAVNLKGPMGSVFKPTVAANGDLSWTLGSDTTVPSTVNIKGEQGPKGDRGDPFAIYATYTTIALMTADLANVPVGKFVMISSNVEDEHNAKLYVRTDNDFAFVTDLSGAQGIRGPQGAHYKPTVASNGDLTWTLYNPEDANAYTAPSSVNIKGPQGDDYVLTNNDKEEIADLALEREFEAKQLYFENTTVPLNAWMVDNTYEGYEYRADLGVSQLPGITASMIPEVYFSGQDILSLNFFPLANIHEVNNSPVLSIYCRLPEAITIPTIKCEVTAYSSLINNNGGNEE